MGLFKGIKDNWKKSEAAVVIENLLESWADMLPKPPAKMANTLVERAWDAMPDVLGGTRGQRPHKVTIAAVALARGLHVTKDLGLPMVSSAFAVSLAQIVADVEQNALLYPFSELDIVLLQKSAAALNDCAKTADESPLHQDVANFMGSKTPSTAPAHPTNEKADISGIKQAPWMRY